MSMYVPMLVQWNVQPHKYIDGYHSSDHSHRMTPETGRMLASLNSHAQSKQLNATWSGDHMSVVVGVQSIRTYIRR